MAYAFAGLVRYYWSSSEHALFCNSIPMEVLAVLNIEFGRNHNKHTSLIFTENHSVLTKFVCHYRDAVHYFHYYFM